MVLSRSTTLSTLSVSTPPNSTRSHISAILRVRLLRPPFRKTQPSNLEVAYMKKVKEALKEKNAPEETITAFEKGAQAYAKKIVANFKDYDFYIGESMDPDGMYVFSTPLSRL